MFAVRLVTGDFRFQCCDTRVERDDRLNETLDCGTVTVHSLGSDICQNPLTLVYLGMFYRLDLINQNCQF